MLSSIRRMVFSLAAVAVVAVAQTRECPLANIAPDATVSASIEADDCRLADLILFGSTSLAKQYRLTVPQRGIFTLTASSSAIDTVLYVLSSDRRIQYGSNDDSDGTTNSKTLANLPPGSYTLIVVSKRAGVTGAFELKNAAESPRTCTITDLTPGTDVQASFSSSSCRGVDWAGSNVAALAGDAQMQNRYRIRLDKTAVISAQVESSLRPLLALSPETGTGSTITGAGQLLASQPSGAQILRVQAADPGSYTLKTTREDPRPCTAKTLEFATPVEGSFQASSCRYLDLFTPSANTTYVDRYRFTVSARQVVTINQKSADMDSFLVLYNSRNAILAIEDDIDDDNLDARIVIHLPPGTYSLYATQTRNRDGAYSLDAASEDPRKCDPKDLTLGAPIDGTLADSGCRLVDAVEFESDATFATAYRVTLTNRQMLKLDLNVNSRNGGTVTIATPDARLVNYETTDDDNNAAIELLLNPGTYLILITSSDTARPPYTLRGAVRDQPACPSADIGLNDSVDGTLSSSDCKIGEMLLESGVPTIAKQYNVTATVAGRVTLDMNSTDFPGIVVVANENDEILGAGVRGSPGRVVIAGPVTPGTYKLFVSSASVGGAYTFKVSFDTGAPTADVTSFRAVGETGDESGVWSGLRQRRPGSRVRAVRNK